LGEELEQEGFGEEERVSKIACTSFAFVFSSESFP